MAFRRSQGPAGHSASLRQFDLQQRRNTAQGCAGWHRRGADGGIYDPGRPRTGPAGSAVAGISAGGAYDERGLSASSSSIRQGPDFHRHAGAPQRRAAEADRSVFVTALNRPRFGSAAHASSPVRNWEREIAAGTYSKGAPNNLDLADFLDACGRTPTRLPSPTASLAIDRVLRPDAAKRTIRARFKSRCNVTGERQHASSTLRSFFERWTSLASGIIPMLNHDSCSKESGY